MRRNKAGRGYLFYYIESCLQHKKELCMSPRQMRIYWKEPKMDVPPAGCYSRLLKYRIPIWSGILIAVGATHISKFIEVENKNA